MNAIVKDVMTTQVVAVPKTATFKELATLLRERRVSAFPVVDGGKVVGVVSEADLLAKEALDVDRPGMVGGILHHRERDKAAGIRAEDLMTTPPVTVGPRDFVADAARLMYARRVKRLPVVDEDGSLVGIVSRADVLSVYSRLDADIRHDITEGVILDTMLMDVVEAARHVEGVVAVRDRLSYPHAVREASPVGPLF